VRAAAWRGSTELRHFEGRPVRLRFVMRDADLYAFQFCNRKPAQP